MEFVLFFPVILFWLGLAAVPITALVLAIKNRHTIQRLEEELNRVKNNLSGEKQAVASEIEIEKEKLEEVARNSEVGIESAGNANVNHAAADIDDDASNIQEKTVSSVSAEIVAKTEMDSDPVAAVSSQSDQVVSSDDFFTRFLLWFKQDFFMKIGAFLIFLAVSWFVQYAIAQNWIGITGRLVLGWLLGILIVFWGFRDARRRVQERGMILLGTGATIIIAVTSIGQLIYGVLPMSVAAFLMLVTVCFTTFSALQFNSRSLIGYTLILASLIPVLITRESHSFVGLFIYLLVLVIGSIWIVYFKKWHFLVLESLIIVFLYSLLIFAAFIEVDSRIFSLIRLFLVYFLAIIFTGISLVMLTDAQALRNKNVLRTYIKVVVISVLYIILWTELGVAQIAYHLRSFFLLFWAAIFFASGYLVYYLSKRKGPFFLYGSAGLSFLTLVMVHELANSVFLFIALLLEAILAIVVTAILIKEERSVVKTSVLLLIPFGFTFDYFTAFNYHSLTGNIFFPEALAVYFFIFAIGGLFWFLKNYFQNSGRLLKTLLTVLQLALIWCVLILLWQIPPVFFTDNVATIISLVLWTIVGLIFYLQKELGKVFHWLGVGILSIVILHLFLIEVWYLSITGRIIAFILVGIGLIATAFLHSNRHNS